MKYYINFVLFFDQMRIIKVKNIIIDSFIDKLAGKCLNIEGFHLNLTILQFYNLNKTNT